MTEPKRVVVFIDYQNVYKRARGCFFPRSTNHVEGQIHPRRLGLKLKGVGRQDRTLTEVRVYRGLPSNKHDPKGYRAAQRQVDLWEQQSLVRPLTRPLNYRDPSSPREKGIDVAVAVDFFAMAVRGEYDVGILFSGDTDLLPALEAVMVIAPEKRPEIEVASWMGEGRGSVQRLRLAPEFGSGPPCHLLRRIDFNGVEDSTDYNVGRRR